MATIISLEHIRTDGGTQFRVTLNPATVDEYAEAMQEGAVFPPVEVFSDGSMNHVWLSDGFHRIAAARKAGFTEFPCDVIAGTQRDAVLKALSANHNHGLRRSNDDKRKAVVFCLRDPELRKLSQHQIAKLCGVTQAMVSKVNAEINPKGDNGYQPLDTPEQALERMTDEERDDFIGWMLRNSTSLWDDKRRKRLQQLGLITGYGDGGTIERTPLAAQLFDQLVNDGDPWRTLELELWQAAKAGSRRIETLGRVRPLLEALCEAAGWASDREFSYDDRSWLAVLVEHEFAQAHEVKLDSWDTRRFYHVTPKGCRQLGLPYSIPIKDPPTVEVLKAEEAARRAAMNAEWRAQQAQRAAEYKASLDPEKEAKDERESFDYRFDEIREGVAQAEWLTFDDARTEQIMALLRQAQDLIASAPTFDARQAAPAEDAPEAEVESI